jgi:glycosyltransferase involved in cell wall biosynthesis
MRILHTESHTDWGGQEIGTYEECLYLLEQGHQVMAACRPGSGLEKACLAGGVPVASFSLMRKALFSPLVFIQAVILIVRFKPHVIHCHGAKDHWIFGLAGRALGLPVVRTRHNSVRIKPSRALTFIYRDVPQALIARGEKIKEQLVRDAQCPPGMITSIPVGARVVPPLSDSEREALRSELGVGRMRVVACVAGLRQWKGQRLLLEAWPKISSQHPDTALLLVGEGGDRGVLEEMIESRGIERVILTGFRNDVPAIMDLCDIHVLPSIGIEGIPQVILQAWAAGAAVVATPVGSVTDLVDDGVNGLLVEPGDVPSLAAGIGKILGDRQLLEKLKAGGQDTLEQGYRMEDTFRKVEEIYHELARQNISSR